MSDVIGYLFLFVAWTVAMVYYPAIGFLAFYAVGVAVLAGGLCSSMVEHSFCKREMPVRFRPWAFWRIK